MMNEKGTKLFIIATIVTKTFSTLLLPLGVKLTYGKNSIIHVSLC